MNIKTSYSLNKRLKLFSLTIALVLSAILYPSCKRNFDPYAPDDKNTPFIRKSGGNPPQFTQEEQIDAHLKWIARGLAHWPKPAALVREIDSLTTITTNDSNENAILFLDSLYNFGVNHNDSIDNSFSSNNYDEDGLGGFELNGITYFTKIFIPNTYYNINKPFIVVPDYVEKDSNTNNQHIGYFKKSGGGIDSITINESNEDNYYIWVIGYYTIEEYDEWEASQGDSLIKKSGRVLSCDNDGICDPAERYNPSCTDCYPNPPQKYKLEITKIEVFTDNCPRAERLFGGKYEFAVTYGLEDRTGSPTIPIIGFINEYYKNVLIKRLPKKEVCREKCVWGGTKGNNCPSHIHDVNYVLYEEIVPSTFNSKMMFILFERDYGPAAQTIYWDYANYDLKPGDCADACEPYYFSWQAAYSQSTVNLYDMWNENNHNGSTRIIGNNEAKVTIELKKL